MLLTVAIPTYNRIDFLKETVNAIIPQVIDCNDTKAQVEILVCDNASTDGTNIYLNGLVEKYDFIRIHREIENGGIDKNIHNCAVYSKGKYVFSLSDDDVPAPNTISHIIKYVIAAEKKDDNVFIFLNGYVFSGIYNRCITDEVVFKEQKKDIVFKNKEDFVEMIGVWSTFVSSFVYKRDVWMMASEGNRFIGTDIYLTYVLYSSLRFCTKMIIISTPLIAIRAQYSGNYKILKAFCIEFGHLLNHVSINEWGYDAKRNYKIFQKSIYSNLINKIIDVRSLPMSFVPKEEIYKIRRTLKPYKVEFFLVICMLTLPLVFARFMKKILTILGVRTNNFHIE